MEVLLQNTRKISELRRLPARLSTAFDPEHPIGTYPCAIPIIHHALPTRAAKYVERMQYPCWELTAVACWMLACTSTSLDLLMAQRKVSTWVGKKVICCFHAEENLSGKSTLKVSAFIAALQIVLLFPEITAVLHYVSLLAAPPLSRLLLPPSLRCGHSTKTTASLPKARTRP